MSNSTPNKNKEKEYKCRGCKRVSTILTMGDMYQGCASCGSRAGFDERINGGKWIEVKKTKESDILSGFMDEL